MRSVLDHFPEADADVCLLAILLHDIGWWAIDMDTIIAEGFRSENILQSDVRYRHEAEGVKLATEVLRATGWDAAIIAQVCEIIDGHDTRPDATHDMLVLTEETFGPVLGICPVDDPWQALKHANDNRYGLAATEKLDGTDVLVNNAAMYGGLERRFFEYIDEEVWDRVMSVNIKGVWQMCRAFSPALRASKGAIVNIASATVFSGSPQWMHYVASKGAVIAMSRTMAKEMGEDGVRVNVIAPGFTLTEASFGHVNDARSYGVDRSSLKRPAEVEDIVGGALMLASPLSSYMTGQTMVIDGGRQFN